MIITYKTLEKDCPYAQLEAAAGLIWDTDPYIYPAMFSSRAEAVGIIPRMFLAGDAMFRPEHLFAAESGGEVIGIILWTRGPLKWTPEIYRRCGGSSPHIERVRRGYFDSYRDIAPDMISLINVCVKDGARGKGVGGAMLDRFIGEHDRPMELYVLADNDPAIRLYSSRGFGIVETLRGFSLEDPDPKCHRMVRNV